MYLLCENPIVFGHVDIGDLDMLKHHAPPRCELHAFVRMHWNSAPWKRVLKRVLDQRRASPLRIHWMCNTMQEMGRLRLLGQRAQHCHHNLFCSEWKFRVGTAPERKWHAVYIAAFVPYKRPWLAASVPRLRFITRALPVGSRPIEYGCEHAVINESLVPHDQVVSILNESHCGLALSAEEGGMYAITEYLLCGLPVVTTPSIGGRDVWYTPDNHLLVPPHREAVAAAVQHLVTHPPDPQRIRKDALQLMGIFRKRYVDYLNKLAGKAISVQELFGDEECLLKRFVLQCNLPELLRSYDGKMFQARQLIGSKIQEPL